MQEHVAGVFQAEQNLVPVKQRRSQGETVLHVQGIAAGRLSLVLGRVEVFMHIAQAELDSQPVGALVAKLVANASADGAAQVQILELIARQAGSAVEVPASAQKMVIGEGGGGVVGNTLTVLFRVVQLAAEPEAVAGGAGDELAIGMV